MFKITDNLEAHFHQGVFRTGTVSELVSRVRHALKDESPAPGSRPLWHLLRVFELSHKPTEVKRIAHAAQKGDAGRLVQALKRADPVHAPGSAPPLTLAVLGGDIRSLQVLLAHGGCDVNEANLRDEWRPLDFAARDGRLDMLELLLAHGAEAWPGSPTSPVAVHWAARGDHGEVIRCLLDQAGVDPNRCDAFGVPPLCAAAIRGCANAIAALREDPRTHVDVFHKGMTPLMLAVEHDQLEALAELMRPRRSVRGSYAQFGQILPGADATKRTPDGTTALLLAIRNKNVAAVTWFAQHLNAKAINQATVFGVSPIEYALLDPDEHIVQALLCHKQIDVRAAVKNMDTASRLLPLATFDQRVGLILAMTRHHGAQKLEPVATRFPKEWAKAVDEMLQAQKWCIAEQLVEAATFNNRTLHFAVSDAQLASLFEATPRSSAERGALRMLVAHAGEADLHRLSPEKLGGSGTPESSQAAQQALLGLPADALAGRLAAITLAAVYADSIDWRDGTPIDLLFQLAQRRDAREVARKALALLSQVNGDGLDGAGDGLFHLHANDDAKWRMPLSSRLIGRLEEAARKSQQGAESPRRGNA
jgi:ankyrin repeat protein